MAQPLSTIAKSVTFCKVPATKKLVIMLMITLNILSLLPEHPQWNLRYKQKGNTYVHGWKEKGIASLGFCKKKTPVVQQIRKKNMLSSWYKVFIIVTERYINWNQTGHKLESRQNVVYIKRAYRSLN